MPRMATGYWNARNTPARARASGAIASRSLPSYSTWPVVLRVEDLILADFGGRSLVLHNGGAVAHVDVRESVRPAPVADQHRVALRVVASLLGALQDLHEAAVGVLPATRRDALRDDRRAGVLAHVDHLGARVRLLAVRSEERRVGRGCVAR